MINEALALRVDEAVWTCRGRFDAAAAFLADRHYSREVVGSPQVGGPGFLLVLVTPCERGLWISKRHDPGASSARALADGFLGYRCALFRNETGGRASDLIRAAVDLTERLWGPAKLGWMTYVDTAAVASEVPGYCFRRAGWRRDRAFEHDRLLRFVLPGAR